jgi:DNA-binding beta-propeller fold protein YncE
MRPIHLRALAAALSFATACSNEGGTAATGSSGTSADGLAIDPAGKFLYAAHWIGNSAVSTVSLPDATVTFYANAQVDLGYSTTGLLVDAGGDLLMKSWVASQAVLIAP